MQRVCDSLSIEKLEKPSLLAVLENQVSVHLNDAEIISITWKINRI